MNCPVCRVDMIVVEYEGVELDHCVKCGGVWFDRDELDFLLDAAHLRVDDLHLKAAPREALDAAKEKPRRCPRCRKRMKKIAVGGADPLILDRCERHGGYWFDGGELARTVRANVPEGEWTKVAGFLGGLFSATPEKEKN